MGPSLGITCGPIGMESSPIFDGPRKKQMLVMVIVHFIAIAGLNYPSKVGNIYI